MKAHHSTVQTNKSHLLVTEKHPRGFCSNFLCLLGAIDHAKKTGQEIDVMKPGLFSLYLEDEKCSFQSILECKRITSYSCVYPSEVSPKDIGELHPRDLSQKGIEILSALYTQEIIFSRFLRAALLKQLRRMKRPKRPFFSVHRRSTDHGMHGKIRPLSVFYDVIDRQFEEHEQFYLATDCKRDLEAMHSRYGNRCLYQKCFRSSSSDAIHFSSDRPSGSEMAVEVLVDIVIMAKSSHIICTNSGVPLISRILNPSVTVTDLTLEQYQNPFQ